MPTVEATLPAPVGAGTERLSCVITSPAGTVRLPSTSPEVQFTDLGGAQWVETPVFGDAPILGVSGTSRAKVKLTGYLFDYRNVSAEQQITSLRNIHAGGRPVTVAFGARLAASTWVITDLDITYERMTIEAAARQVAFTIGLTAYAASKPPKPPSATTTPKPRKPPRRIAIRAGETLSQFAARVTGDASAMRLIAADNGIRNPDRVKAGFVFTVNY
jgi:phage protein U